ncbi:fatty acid-binding protein-like [Pectinophora gossypiella]|uniref:Lipocalin/cytosolic fatty-acid binding domain-containing protein n=1 Tax=Pectinophora gossypiella TaxID=13191 RepID=A0A1E1VZL1_PECGO|nr:fatty acid-binding protein-like [Pectinophora gossypiella]
MPSIAGKYEHYKNENLDEYFAACGLPYVVRKMISLITPIMEIILEDDVMTLRVTSWLWSSDHTFKLGEKYIEQMPKDNIISVTKVVNDHEVLTESVIESTGDKAHRHYLFTDEEVVETLTHEKAKGVTKRYYKRIK